MKILWAFATTMFSLSSFACPAKYQIDKNLTLHQNSEFTEAKKEMEHRNYLLNSSNPDYTFSFRVMRRNLHYNAHLIRAYVSLDVLDKNGEHVSYSGRGSKKTFNDALTIPLKVYEDLMVELVDELPKCN